MSAGFSRSNPYYIVKQEKVSAGFSRSNPYYSVPQWPSDISGNDWLGPINSSQAADRMSDIFSERISVFLPKFALGTRKNDHVCP